MFGMDFMKVWYMRAFSKRKISYQRERYDNAPIMLFLELSYVFWVHALATPNFLKTNKILFLGKTDWSGVSSDH